MSLLGDEIVFLRGDYGDFGELADGEGFGDEDAGIDVGGVGFAAGEAGGFDEDADLFADGGGGLFQRDAALEGHGFFPAGFLGA